MKVLKLATIGAALAMLGLVVGLALAGPASAQTSSLVVTSGSAVPGGEGTVQLIAEAPAPGLGAWTIDIQYDNTVITAVDCGSDVGSVCNPAFAANLVRVTGASANGLDGENVLATITFECGSEAGQSALDPIIGVFADATVGDPQVLEPDISPGSFTCQEATPTPVPSDTAVPPTPTATPKPALPKSGTGPGGLDSGNPVTWLIAGLTGAGLAWLIAAVASRRYAPQPAGGGTTPPAGTPPTTVARWLAAARRDLRARGLDRHEPPWRRR
jgi:hypothetical protein